jgi:hypothetical protein
MAMAHIRSHFASTELNALFFRLGLAPAQAQAQALHQIDPTKLKDIMQLVRDKYYVSIVSQIKIIDS